MIGWILNPLQDMIYAKKFPQKGPEARLYSACVAAVFFPLGCFICQLPASPCFFTFGRRTLLTLVSKFVDGWTSYPDVSIAGP